MTTALKSVVLGAVITVGAVFPIMFVYTMWIFFVSPGIARQGMSGSGEVGIDVVTLARNTPSFWVVEGIVFVAASVVLYCRLSKQRRQHA